MVYFLVAKAGRNSEAPIRGMVVLQRPAKKLETFEHHFSRSIEGRGSE